MGHTVYFFETYSSAFDYITIYYLLLIKDPHDTKTASNVQPSNWKKFICSEFRFGFNFTLHGYEFDR